MSRSQILLLVVALIATPVAAEPVWVPLTDDAEGAPVAIEVVRATAHTVEIEVEIGGLWLDAVTTEAGEFTRVVIPDAGWIGPVGGPQLPGFRRLVEIPAGATATVRTLELERQTVDLSDRALPVRPYPRQEPRPKCAGETWSFSFDQTLYEKASAAPAARIDGPYGLRDHRMALLTVAPVSWAGSEDALEVVTRARVTLDLVGADLEATSAVKSRYASRAYDAFLLDHALNLDLGLGEGAGWAYPDTAPIELLVISPPALAADLAPWVEWKTSCGYHVTVATTDDPSVGTTTASIKAFIADLYANAPAPPVYVLMIGDSPSPLVTWTVGSGGGGGTDLPYVQMDGDLYPDLMIARWPVDDAAELMAMRDKILHYQQPTAADSAWLDRALFLAGDDYMGRVTTHEDVIAELMEPAPNGAECALWYGDTQNPTTQQLIDDLNTGRAWTVYSAHSGPGGWSGDPPLSSGDIPTMANAGMYPIAHGHSCSSNEWNAYDDVFGESAVIHASKGFVSYWGGSASTYWDEDDWLERGFFDAMFDADMVGSAQPSVDRHYSNIAACYSGLTEVTLKGGMEDYYWHCYNLNGDPTLDPFTRQPLAMTVSAPAAIPPVAGDFTVSVGDAARGAVPLALVGVSQDGVLLGAGMTDDTGVAQFPIDEPQPGIDLLVRVTAHNHLPTDAATTVAAGSEGIVVLDAGVYRCDSTVGISVFDDDLAGLGSIGVLVTATSGDGQVISLAEVGGAVVRFDGSLVLGTDLACVHGDTLTVTYHDADTGSGTPADATDTALLDCAGPVVSNLEVIDIGAESAVISWTTDEPATSWTELSPGGIVVSDAALVTDHALLVEGLASCTEYSAVVASEDALGNSTGSGPTGIFQTMGITVPLDDDVESGPGDWTVDTYTDPPGGTNWSIVTDPNASSPTHSWFSSDDDDVKDDRLESAPMPIGFGTTLLSFWHHYDFEGGYSNYDGGVLEVSADGGAWMDVEAAGGVFVEGGYTGELSDWGSNPLGGRSAFVAGSGGLVHTVVDLSSLAGSSVRVRFRLGCDGSVSDVGWYVDDIRLETSGSCPLFADGFESGDCALWSLMVP